MKVDYFYHQKERQIICEIYPLGTLFEFIRQQDIASWGHFAIVLYKISYQGSKEYSCFTPQCRVSCWDLDDKSFFKILFNPKSKTLNE